MSLSTYITNSDWWQMIFALAATFAPSSARPMEGGKPMAAGEASAGRRELGQLTGDADMAN
jgi:hypothetical protein